MCVCNFKTSTKTKKEKSKNKTIEASRFREISIPIKITTYFSGILS